jgi:hypothetical protein
MLFFNLFAHKINWRNQLVRRVPEVLPHKEVIIRVIEVLFHAGFQSIRIQNKLGKSVY